MNVTSNIFIILPLILFIWIDFDNAMKITDDTFENKKNGEEQKTLLNVDEKKTFIK